MPKPITRKKWPLAGNVTSPAKSGTGTIADRLRINRERNALDHIIELNSKIGRNSAGLPSKPIRKNPSTIARFAEKRSNNANTLLLLRKSARK